MKSENSEILKTPIEKEFWYELYVASLPKDRYEVITDDVCRYKKIHSFWKNQGNRLLEELYLNRMKFADKISDIEWNEKITRAYQEDEDYEPEPYEEHELCPTCNRPWEM